MIIGFVFLCRWGYIRIIHSIMASKTIVYRCCQLLQLKKSEQILGYRKPVVQIMKQKCCPLFCFRGHWWTEWRSHTYLASTGDQVLHCYNVTSKVKKTWDSLRLGIQYFMDREEKKTQVNTKRELIGQLY